MQANNVSCVISHKYGHVTKDCCWKVGSVEHTTDPGNTEALLQAAVTGKV